jgi:diguanylate cyclase (GGDEF)-like protein
MSEQPQTSKSLRPYIEPSIRTIAGALLIVCALLASYRPDLRVYWLGFLFFIAINLFQSGLSRFCLMEKILKRLGFRSEMDEIRSMALHDALTGLPNRVLLEDRINLAIAQARRTGNKVAALFIDLDNFKQVNDIQGHKAGDDLLVTISRVFRQHLREYDTLARWGGDEFVVLLPNIDSVESARRAGEKLMACLDHEVAQERHLHTTLSIGLALYPDDASDTESLLIQADKAVYYCKSQGRNNIQVFSEMSATNTGYADTNLTSRFTAAIKNQQLHVHYQPIVDATTRQVVSIEALARWHDEQHGWISPGVFIPMAETMGLIEEVGRQITESALRDYSECSWQDRIRLAINVSNRQLFSKTFLPTILAAVHERRVNPDSIKLEITESTALETDNAVHTIRTLSDAGFYVSLDDFGTGFSSLSRLHELPVDELKIDISFVRRIKTDKGRTMLKTITDMGRAMNLKLVAEGVEDKETALILRDMGVDYLQGYYFAKPQDKLGCLKFIESQTRECGDGELGEPCQKYA